MGMNFKHLGVMDQLETLRDLVSKLLKIKNLSEIHETWHGVMKWHQHAVAIFFQFGTSFGISLLQARASH